MIGRREFLRAALLVHVGEEQAGEPRVLHVNALLFDFVLKRNLRIVARRLPDSAFETRGFFERP